MTPEAFQKKVAAKKAKVGVMGLGYVGLPLAVTFAGNGFSVKGIEIDREKVAKLARSSSYVLDVRSSDLKEVMRRGFFQPTGDTRVIASLDAVVVCVPTPWNKIGEPDMSYVRNAAQQISKYLKKGQLVVFESTMYPGATEEVIRPVLEETGLKAEKDFYLAFSPERVDPGNKNYALTSIPKVVGGTGPRSLAAAASLYRAVMKTVVEVSSAKTAEMVKLLENTFRSVNIGLINEVAQISHHLGIDIWEVIEAAKTKPFGFMPFYPGPGIGGHCLPIDPLYLAWQSRRHHFEAKMIELASSINESMPLHVVERVRALLNQKKRPLKGASVLLLGVSYKKNVDDVRESPALDVAARLLEEGASLSYSDPYVPSFRAGRVRLKSRALSPALLKKQHCVVVLTDHAAFDGPMILAHAQLVFDTRNFLRKFEGHGHGRLHFL